MQTGQSPGSTGYNQARTEFEACLARLKEDSTLWLSRPRSPETHVISGALALLDMASRQMDETRLAMDQGVRQCEVLLEQCRAIQREEHAVVRRSLEEGVRSIQSVRTINEDTVKRKLVEIVSQIRSEVATTIRRKVYTEMIGEATKVTARTAFVFTSAGVVLFMLGHTLR